MQDMKLAGPVLAGFIRNLTRETVLSGGFRSFCERIAQKESEIAAG